MNKICVEPYAFIGSNNQKCFIYKLKILPGKCVVMNTEKTMTNVKVSLI